MKSMITPYLRLLCLACLLATAGTSSLWAQYCLPTYNSACTSDDYINSVNFAGIVNSNTGCNGPAPSNYSDFSGTFTGNVLINQPYTITVSPGPTWGQYFIALIDINHDNDFADAGEFYDIGYSLGGGTVSNTITVPCGALTGATRLRIMCRYANTPLTLADICATGLSFGEIEDYNLIISQPSNMDGAITKFVSPVTACGMTATEQVSVRIKNVGGQTINGYTVCYTLNNGAPICETVATVIAPCDSVTHLFATTANLSVTGQYDFDATLTVAGDANTANNALTNYYVDNIPVIGTIPYSQNFDAGNGGWTTTGTNSSWAWGAPTGTFINAAASSPNAWVTNLSGLYNPDETSFLVSPCFNFAALTADPYFSFSHISEMPNFSDLAYLELSTNAGTTWTKVGNGSMGNNWYNNLFDLGWYDVTGSAGAWRDADHQLTGAAGSANVRVRFAFVTDAFTEMEGMGVDDVKIVDTLRNSGPEAIVAPVTGCQLSATSAVTIAVHNYGSHTISNIPVCYTVNGGPATCETIATPIAPGTSLNYTFTATANLSVVGSYNIAAYTNWSLDYSRDNDTLRSTVQSLPVVNTFPYRESFEASNGNWASGGTAFNDWAWGDPNKSVINTAGAGTNCWITAGLNPGDYQDNANNWVESPCFDLTNIASPWVLLKVFWNSEISWDGAVLEATTNGGTTWTQIGAYLDPFNWYNDNTITGLVNYGGTGDGWTGQGTGWLQAKHEIASLGGLSAVRFRIHFATDGSVTDEGFAFDDFIIAQAPDVDLGPDTAICASVVLDPGLIGGTYLWTGGATTPTLTVTVPGTYVLEYTDSLGLVGADTIVISQSPTPIVDLGSDSPVCAGDSVCFTVSATDYPSILWSTGVTGNQICVTTSGTWSIEVVDTLGCTSRDTVNTTLVAIPTPFIGADTSICAGDTICLASNCGPNHTYVWSNGATTDVICVSFISGYWVQCTDVNGCTGGDSIIISQAALPIALGAADTSNCPIVQFSNTSTGTTTFWDFGDGNTSTSASPSHDYTAAGNGSYVVTLISSNPCGSDTITMPVDINCLVSIGSALDNQVKLFPNPSQGKFRLETTLVGTAPVTVTIADLHGKNVFARDFGQTAGQFSEEITLDVAKGVYFVKLAIGDQVAVRKLVLQ